MHEVVTKLVPEAGWPEPLPRPKRNDEEDFRLGCLMRGLGAAAATMEWRKTPEGTVHDDFGMSWDHHRRYQRHGTDAVAAVHPPHRGPAWTVQVEQTPHRGHRRRNNLATVRQDHEMGWVEGDGFRRGF